MSRASREPAHLGFVVAEELGETMLMRYGRLTAPEAPVVWEYLPHQDFDGIGGFAEMLRRHESYELPREAAYARDPTPPPWRKRLAAIRATLEREKASPHRPGVPWARFDRAAPVGIPQAVGYAILDAEESRRLAAARSPSMNSRLLWALDRAITVLLREEHPPRLWLMPVNMRGTTPASASWVNPVAGVAIEFAEGASVAAVHAAVKMRLAQAAQWGSWDVGRLRQRLVPVTMLRRAMLAYYGRRQHAWMGTFSNLGDWTAPGRGARYLWVGVPPVTVTHPITAAVMGWGGRFTLTVQAHPALGASAADAIGWAEQWKALTLATLGGDATTPARTASA